MAYKYVNSIIDAVLGGDNPANAAESDATAYLLIDGPLYNILGDPNSGFIGEQSWRSLAPSTIFNDKTSYSVGDERVQWDGTFWKYFNVYSSRTWEQLGASIDGEAEGDRSGYSVSMNATGDRMVVGAPTNDGTSGTDRGSVRVYELTNGSWTQLGEDIDGEASGDWSGYSVDINDVGDRIAIGSPYNTNYKGSVRIYRLIDGSWSQMGLDIDGIATNDWHGNSVSMNAVGDRIAIGAYFSDPGGYTNNGITRIYEWNNNSWSQLGGTITGVDGSLQSSAYSGFSVSMNAVGDRVVIGAVGNDGGGGEAGNVRVYQLTGSSWVQLGLDIDGSGGDESGFSVSINATGDRIALSSRTNSNYRGYVKIYEWNNTSWVQLGGNIVGDADGDEVYSVSLNASGDRVAIGATIYEEGSALSYVKIYELISGVWTQLDVNIVAESFEDDNGHSVSLNASGDRVAIGAPYNDGVNGVDSGSVRVFEYTPVPFSTSSDDVERPWLATWTNGFSAAKVTPSYSKSTNYPAVP